MKNIHILPTLQPSRLWFHKLNRNLGFSDLPMEYNGSGTWVEGRNIYITSDEEIKEGDWGLSKLNEVILFGRSYNEKFYKKIILTTDQDLIKDGVCGIEDGFLEWFVNNPNCEKVEVKQEKIVLGEVDGTTYIDFNYKIIIPKEEPKKHKVIIVGNGIPKQEILEEAKLRQLFKNRSNCYADADADEVVQAMDEDCFISTINEWKQDQDKKLYSEGEVIGMLKLFVTMLKKNHTHTYTIDFEKSVKKWFEKFKKK